ncbi:sulfite exporter TauE/SafE family protein [Schlegelella sp. S2-27]|uniref:Probable membrane transporter protein n=1 Tax=Caldimonas mangrovi TaxID=2944811 RepID=A0ABT0YML2_9BURK|nr:sulfite exporter TauE/SafE family protein [Caldimonas mangrovi]MCM5679962.1 sulfite exporter TauE/SafE family protein [Caldimonas mangrovi]
MGAETWFIALGAMAAGFVQGLSGFAFGMVAMSIWVWGVDPRLAAVLAVFGGLTGQVIATFTVPRRWNWPMLLPLLSGAAVGVPLGVWVLPLLDAGLFKLVFGAFLLVCCPLLLMAPRLPRIGSAGWPSDALTGAAGGFMGGLGGFTGVVPTLWYTLRGLEKDVQRGLIQNFNLAALSVTMAAYVATGAVTAPMWPALAIVAASLLVPALIGARLYIGLSQQAFRQVVLVLLTLSGAAVFASGVAAVVRG